MALVKLDLSCLSMIFSTLYGHCSMTLAMWWKLSPLGFLDYGALRFVFVINVFYSSSEMKKPFYPVEENKEL